MMIDVPDHTAVDISIMLLSIGYQMIKEKEAVPTELHSLAPVFNQLMEDEQGIEGDFFESIAQKFEDVTTIIRTDPMVAASSSYKGWA